jgi:hypothetical protein
MEAAGTCSVEKHLGHAARTYRKDMLNEYFAA